MSILEISEDKAVLIYITLILLKCSLKEVNIFYKCNKYYHNLNFDTFYIVDIVHTSGADENSKEYLAEMNTCYQDLVTAAKEVEETRSKRLICICWTHNHRRKLNNFYQSVQML